MAGRKQHIQGSEEFEQFIQSIPEDSRGRGYWHIKRESPGANGGGVMQSIMGWLEFQPGESYEALRARIKSAFADKKGPGVYFANPCDQGRQSIKNLDKARFEYKESEVEMPEIPGSESNPLGDTLKTVKRAANDMAALQNLELQQKIMNKFLGTDEKDKKKEEESVDKTAAAGSNFNDILMWKTFMGDDSNKKKDAPSDALQQQLNEAKLQNSLADMRAEIKGLVNQPKNDDKLERMIEKSNDENRRLIEKMMELSKPKDDDKITRLIEKSSEDSRRLIEKMMELSAKPKEDTETKALLQRMIDKESSAKQENAFQSMMALTMKQQEEHNKTRAEEERRRRDDQGEFEKRRIEDERRKEDERKEEKHRLEEERKVESKKVEDQIRLEREKFQDELKEQKRRFDEEMKLRREEMKHDEEKARLHSGEQQKLQLQLLEAFKDKSNSGLDMTKTMLETMTSAGMNSMKTAQAAAETIMDVAKAANPREKDKGGGIGEILKDVGNIAGPLLAPYANADAQLKMLQSAAAMQGQARRTNIDARRAEQARQQALQARAQREAQARAQAAAVAAAHAAGAAGQPAEAPQQAPQTETAETVAAEGGGLGEAPAGETMVNPQEGSSMIAEYLKHYPIVKEALIDNLTDGVGVDMYIGVITGLNQPTLESLIASLRPKRLMDYIKQACTAEEQKLIDANEAWFAELKKEMILEIKGDDEEAEPSGNGTAAVVPAPTPAPKV